MVSSAGSASGGKTRGPSKARGDNSPRPGGKLGSNIALTSLSAEPAAHGPALRYVVQAHGSAPLAMIMSQPASVQMEAAWSLVVMPPVPRPEPAPPARSQMAPGEGRDLLG